MSRLGHPPATPLQCEMCVAFALTTHRRRFELHEVPRPAGLMPGEGRQVPVVVPLSKVVFPRAGRYDLQVDIDDEIAADLTFTISER